MRDEIVTADVDDVHRMVKNPMVDSAYLPDGHGASWGWSIHRYQGALWQVNWRNKAPDYDHKDIRGNKVYVMRRMVEVERAPTPAYESVHRLKHLPHTFQGRHDRDCDICGLADRNPIHPRSADPTLSEEVIREKTEMGSYQTRVRSVEGCIIIEERHIGEGGKFSEWNRKHAFLTAAAPEMIRLIAEAVEGSVTATGVPGGDCECWCLEVSEQEFRRVAGEREWKVEKEYRNDPESIPTTGSPWRLYPHHLIGHRGEKVQITVVTRPVE